VGPNASLLTPGMQVGSCPISRHERSAPNSPSLKLDVNLLGGGADGGIRTSSHLAGFGRLVQVMMSSLTAP
jgi:hypothetical protein